MFDKISQKQFTLWNTYIIQKSEWPQITTHIKVHKTHGTVCCVGITRAVPVEYHLCPQTVQAVIRFMSCVLQHSGSQKQRHLRSTQSVNSEYWLHCERHVPLCQTSR